jgi:hypothetical protein
VIPAHNQSGVLPPFLSGSSPAERDAISPYKVSLIEVVQRFSNGNARHKIIQGLINYRAELRNVGITSGFQWIDGSFVEDIEKNKGRSPNDVDIITFANRPSSYLDPINWRDLIKRRQDLFLPAESKKKYSCDAYYVDMNTQPELLVSQTRYWFGLFSHQRESFLWKGMLELALEDDSDAVAFLSAGGNNAS